MPPREISYVSASILNKSPAGLNSLVFISRHAFLIAGMMSLKSDASAFPQWHRLLVSNELLEAVMAMSAIIGYDTFLRAHREISGAHHVIFWVGPIAVSG